MYRLTYRRRPLITVAATLLAVILPATAAVAATNIGTATHVAEGKKSIVTGMEWKWSDGSSDPHRVFYSSDYKNAAALPTLLISVPPTQAGLLYLEFEQEGDWNAEWVVRPDSNGKATMPIDPYCADGSWCDGEYKYRLKMPGLTSYIDIEYWDQ